jgi:hypothetical protein
MKDRDLQEWRQRPETALLVQSLYSDAQGALNACALKISEGSSHPAAYQAGWAACAEDIAYYISAKHDKESVPVEVSHG